MYKEARKNVGLQHEFVGWSSEEARALGRHQIVRLSAPISHARKSDLSP